MRLRGWGVGRGRARASRWIPWLVLLGGTFAAVTIAVLEYRLEFARERAHFDAVVHDRTELLSNEARTLLRPVRHIAAVLTFARGEIRDAEFAQTVESIPLAENPVLLSLQWYAVVPGSRSPLLRHTYCPHGDACTTSLSPALVALARQQHNRMTLSSWYEADGQVRVQAIQPVFQPRVNGDLLGFAVGVYRVDRLIHMALERVGSAPVELYIRDSSQPSVGVFAYSNGEVRYAGADVPQFSSDRLHRLEKVALYGGPGYDLAFWEVLGVPGPGAFAPQPWAPLLSALIGIAFSGLLALHLRDLQYRERTVRDLVEKRTEELYRREQEFETLAEGNPDMIARLDRQLRYCYVNSAIAKFFGPPREAFIGRMLGSLGLPGEVAAQVRRTANSAFESGQPRSSEHRLVTTKGELYFDARFLPEKGEGGEIETLLLVARDISSQKRLQHELEQLTMRDPLTGVANRRFLAQFRERDWRYEARHGHDVAFILADLDHFKEYNDRYGHQGGDDCLKQVASALQGSLYRPVDTLVRYGGEEFAIILPETDLSAARQLARRLRTAVEDLKLGHAASPWDTVTISVGVAAMKADEGEFEDLVAAADRALYRAKKGGRNRVECET